jgi:hypothetical protein
LEISFLNLPLFHDFGRVALHIRSAILGVATRHSRGDVLSNTGLTVQYDFHGMMAEKLEECHAQIKPNQIKSNGKQIHFQNTFSTQVEIRSNDMFQVEVSQT